MTGRRTRIAAAALAACTLGAVGCGVTSSNTSAASSSSTLGPAVTSTPITTADGYWTARQQQPGAVPGDSTGITTSATRPGPSPAGDSNGITPAPAATTTRTVTTSAGVPTRPASRPTSTGTARASSGATRSDSSEITPRSGSATAPLRTVGPVLPLAAAPAVPRLTPLPADFVSPTAVVAAYLAAWCYQPLGKPANTNIAVAAAWVTAAGLQSDSGQGLTNQQWAAQVASGLTSMCGPAVAVVSPDAPTGPNLRWVSVTARRAYVNRAGQIVGQQNISQTRRVLQAPDGRWLVDVQVYAG